MTAMMKHFAIVVVTILSAGCASAVEEPPFKITTKRDNDKVEVTVKKGRAVISVCSPFGISQTTIERSGNNWPDVVILRLHLKGLENFKSHQWQRHS